MRATSRRAGTGGLAALVVACVTATLAPQASAQPESPAGAAPQRSPEAVARVVDRLLEAKDVDARDEYAGIWVEERSEGAVVHVGLSAKTTPGELEAAGEPGVTVVTHVKKFKDKQLRDAQKVIDRAIRKGGKAVESRVGYEHGKLFVGVTARDAAAEQALLTGLPQGIVEFYVTGMAQTTNRRWPWWPLTGGLNLTDVEFRCTSAFVVHDGSAAPGPTSLLTAGHCFPQGWYIYQGDEVSLDVREVGAVSRRLWPAPGGTTNFDAEVVTIDNRDRSNRVYITTTTNQRAMTGTRQALEGQTVCQSGVTSGYVCGRVISQRYTVRYGGSNITLQNALVADVISQGGDSGGPVVMSDKGVGITSGVTGGGDLIFTDLVNTLSALRLRLLL